MLFLLNPFDVMHTGTIRSYLYPTELVYILDTDDLVVESVRVRELCKFMENGISVCGCHLINGTIHVSYWYAMMDYFKLKDKSFVSCLSDRLIVLASNKIKLNKAEHSIRGEISDRGIVIKYDNVKVGEYILSSGYREIEPGIAYLYKRGDYFVIRFIVQLKFQKTVVYTFWTTFVINSVGVLYLVLMDNKYDNIPCIVEEKYSSGNQTSLLTKLTLVGGLGCY